MAYSITVWKDTFINNSGKYDQYALYMFGTYPGLNIEEKDSIVTLNFHAEDVVCSRIDKSIKSVAKGSSVYLVPGQTFPVADARRNYTIKRAPDTADYNVVSEDMYVKWTGRMWICSNAYINDAERCILATPRFSPNVSMPVAAREIKKDFSTFRPLTINSGFIYQNTPFTLACLTDSLKKPLVSSSALDLNSDTKPNIELLETIEHLGIRQAEYQNRTNLVFQLSCLNQFSWRKYKGTLSALFSYINAYQGQLFYISNTSNNPKAIRDLVDTCKTPQPFVDKEDVEFFLDFIATKARISEKKQKLIKDMLTDESYARITPIIAYMILEGAEKQNTTNAANPL